MNYLEHHLGDYAKRALSFSMLAHGAYSVLRDRYFTKEQPLPAADVYRVASARTKDEREAVDTVLAEFYRLDGDAWRCDEFDAQLVAARTKIAAAQNNGKKGGRPKKQNQSETEQKPTGFSVGSDSVTQPKAHQTPDTKHQSPEEDRDTHPATDVARVAPEPPGPASPPTMAGAVCITLRAKGIASVNPSHPDLLALLAAGVDVGAFSLAAQVAVDRGRPTLAYVLGVVKGQQADAQRLASQAVASPSQPQGRKDRQLQTAAALTGATQRQPAKEIVDVDARVVPS